MLKRILSMVLCIAMLMTMVPAQVFASEEEPVEAEAEAAASAVETAAAEVETAAPAEKTQETVVETTVTEATEEDTAEPVPETEAVAEVPEETAAPTEETLWEEAAASEQVLMENAAAENSCGEAAIWTLDEGVLTISGTGTMADYADEAEVPWYEEREQITALVIDSGITSVGANAFAGCVALATATLPESVVSIGTNAFSGCNNLVVTYRGTANQWRPIDYRMDKIICSDGVLWDWGDCGEAVAYMIVDDTLRIVGEGAMEDYESSAAPWFELGDLFDKVSVEAGVTAVGANAFYCCHTVTEVSLADTVTTIGANAFEGCTGLITIPLPDGVTTINANAFSGCTGLKHIYIPESVTTIRASSYAYSPFSGCSADLEIYCKAGIRAGGWGSNWNHQAYGVVLTTTFGCDRENYNYWSMLNKSASTITIPEGITLIPVKAFYNRTTLKRVNVPDSLQVINTNAFYGCSNLDHLFISSAVTSILGASYSMAPFGGTGATLYCEDRTEATGWQQYWDYGVSVKWGHSREEYEQWCDLDISGTDVVLPIGITSIPYKAFDNRQSLVSVTIPHTVKTIGERAFANCLALTDIAIPEGVVSVGDSAFYNCAGVLTVSIPASVTEIATSAFIFCDNVLSYWVDAENPCYASDDLGIIFSKDMTTLIKAPGGIVGPYRIPDHVTTIGDSAFLRCDGLEWIFIPDSVTTIGRQAFPDCAKNLSIYAEAESKPEGWDAYWDRDYKSFDRKIAVFYGSSGAEMEYWANLDKTASVIEIPAGISGIPGNAFEGCTNLTDVIIPEGVTGIGIGAFAGCTGLTKIHIPSSVRAIYVDTDEGPFQDCSADLEIYCTADSAPADWESNWNKTAYSGNTLTVYYGYTRADMLLWPEVDKTAANIVLPEGIETVVDRAFYDCDTLKSITVPSSVTTIGGSAFYDCDSLTAITILASVTEIGENAFYGCDNLTITFEGTAQQWMAAVGRTEQTVRVICSDGTIYTWGTCGSNLTYHVIDNKLVISGSGEMYKYASDWNSWHPYREQITEIFLPAGLRNIANSAFSGCSSLTSIDIPEGVTSIGDSAFRDCDGLTGIVLPRGVASIGNSAFYNCSKLASVTLPEGLTSIGDFAFRDCDSLTGIVIPKGVASIGNSAFYSCGSLTSATIREGVTSIGDSAFYNCSKLASVTLSEGLVSIGENAFRECKSLTGIVIPKGVTSIGGYAFNNCRSLESITIPEGVVSIGDYTFLQCTSLTSITLPKGVASIGNSAFFSCSSLTSVTIPESVTSIGNMAFRGCDGLTITYPGTTAQWMAVVELTEGAAKTVCTDGMVYDWSLCGNNLTYYFIDNRMVITGTGEMWDYYFEDRPWHAYREQITEVLLPDGLTRIGGGAFEYCTGLTSVTIPEGVTSIGDNAFSYCDSLTRVTIPEGVTSIESCAFRWCPNLINVTIPEGVTSIGDEAFYYIAITNLTIPESVTSIGSGAFSCCANLASVTIPESITSIPEGLFNSTALTTVTIPESVTSIGAYAFAGCSDLTRIIIPATVTDIDDGAFSACSSLTGITIPEGVTDIGRYTFRECSSLTSITIPKSVTGIGDDAFESCKNLREIIFDGSAPAINPYAFISVRAIAYYPEDNTSWTEDVMQNYGGSITWKPMCSGSHDPVTVPAVAPTCTGTGLTEGTECADCGMVLSGREVIPAKGHTEAVYPAVPPTCTESGMTEGKYCPDCNIMLEYRQWLPALGHTEVIDPAIEPDCTTGGKTEGKHCSVCNEILVCQYDIEPNGHRYGQFEITRQPTCTEAGEQRRNCAICGETATEPVPATGHTEVIDPAVAPTCTGTGLTEGSHCDVCKEVLTAQTVVPAKGHTEAIDPAVAPTCLEPGLTEGKHCSVCNEVLTPQETVPALGHDFSETGITLDPTCTEEGIRSGYCARCGEAIEEAIPALGHTEVIDPAVAVSCVRSGLTEGKHCETCGEIFVAREMIPAEGHIFEEGFCLTCGAEDKGDHSVFSGKGITFKYTDPETGKVLNSKQIKWSLSEEYAPYATLTADGKLTAKKVVEMVRVEAIGTIVGDEEVQVILTADIYPAVTQVEILEGEEVLNGKTVTVDFDEEKRTFTVQAHPLDTVQEVTWSISDAKKSAYASYEVNGNVLTVSDPTGKSGTVTVKATVDAGAKKTVSFKLDFANFAEKVEITNTEETIVSGSSLQLNAVVTPDTVTKTGVVWSLKNAADKTYASIGKTGVLKAKTVYRDTPVTVVATTKDGLQKAEYTVTIQPKDTGMLILTLDGENVTKSILNIDLNTQTVLSLNAENLADGTSVENIIWKSSSAKIATVDDGMVLIHGKGNVTITAEEKVDKKVLRKATVTLKISPLTSFITIEEPDDGLEVASGKEITLKATCEGGVNKVTWSIVDGAQYAKITDKGKLTANKDITSAREVSVRATAADGSCVYEEVNVTIRPLAQGVQIYSEEGGRTLFSIRTSDSQWVRSNTTLEWAMNEAETLQLSARVYPCYEEGGRRNAIQGVTWKSSSNKIATVDEDGLVTCHKPGTVTITATAKDGSGKSVTFKLKVINKIESLSMEDQTVKGGKSLNLEKLLEINPTDATYKTFDWKITGGNGAPYASINNRGVLKTQKVKTPMEVEITVTAQDGSGESAEFTVTITPA